MKKKLLKSLLILSFLLITFFSIKVSVYAASFAYSNFDWDKLLEQNKNFWTSTCDEKDSECFDEVLKTKEKFYTRLYELLDRVQKDYGFIDDNIIIATVFYGLNADSFADPDINEYNPYNLDENENTKNKFIGSDDGDRVTAKSYFDKETDSLKSLINNFIGYSSVCYAYTNEQPQTYTDNKGKTYIACSRPEIKYIDGKCIAQVDKYKGNFFDSLGLSFLGTENEKKCKSSAQELGYKSPYLETSSTKEVNEEFFYDFLETSDYFDNKKHLRSYFAVVLQHSGYETMEEFYKATESDPELLEKYKDDIIEARKRIISGIKSVLEMYGEENFSKVSQSFKSTIQNSYWWPIGSKDIRIENDVAFANDDPASLNVINDYGSVNTGSSSMNRGIDIAGDEGITPVIAAQDGLVVNLEQGVTGDCISGDDNCGSGYGNYIVIQHTDGNYTLYAHMHTNSLKVKNGDTVKKGQVIGYVGSTGTATRPYLHFEVRLGTNSIDNTVDPKKYINSADPRSTAGSLTYVNGDSNQQSICLSLKSSGVSENGVAALLSNLYAESGFNPNIIGDNGTSYGLCQWHNGRWTNLKNSYPNSWQTIDGQLHFLFDELHNGYSNLYNSLISGSESASTLTYNFCYNFERPANMNQTCTNRANNSSKFSNYVSNGCN